MKKIGDMTDKELNKFIIINDIDLDPNDFDDTDKLAEAVIEKVEEALAADDDDPKKGKKGGKKKAEEPEIEVGSDVKWTDEDQDEHEGTVKKIKKGVATVKEGKKEYEVEVSDLELA